MWWSLERLLFYYISLFLLWLGYYIHARTSLMKRNLMRRSKFSSHLLLLLKEQWNSSMNEDVSPTQKNRRGEISYQGPSDDHRHNGQMLMLCLIHKVGSFDLMVKTTTMAATWTVSQSFVGLQVFSLSFPLRGQKKKLVDWRRRTCRRHATNSARPKNGHTNTKEGRKKERKEKWNQQMAILLIDRSAILAS